MSTIGIVGFGVVGLAGLRLFVARLALLRKFLKLSQSEPINFVVWDQKERPIEHAALLAQHGVRWVTASESAMPEFFEQVDWALVSPGVNLSAVANQQHKFICELDILQYAFAGGVLGITGSLGKTTVTKLIYQILKRFYEQHNRAGAVALGGNVGIGMLDLLREAEQPAWAVLELSSFQLEYSFTHVPKIGVWSNLFPNHLDRHGSMPAYFESKANLFRRQSVDCIAVLGTQLFDESTFPLTMDLLQTLPSKLVVAGQDMLPAAAIASIPQREWISWMVVNGVLSKCQFKDGVLVDAQPIVPVSKLPACTFRDNWAVIFAALDGAGVDIEWLVHDMKNHTQAYQPNDSHHRLEFVVRSAQGVDFYNDSKSTVKESTLAAAHQLALSYKEVRVIIGGLGKGVDRTDFGPLLTALPEVKNVIAFGKEASLLGASITTATLDDAVHIALRGAGTGAAVLFSPGGASFDLFKNYEHRGDCFKELVTTLCT
jgi:UDP-N-acetylmuramoylalanine--D-glutamate ligase